MIFKTFSVKEKVLFALQSITFLGLFLYSFSQIDLGLTFSKITFLRNIVTYFQHIGYFERPLSSLTYVFLVSLLTLLYCVTLYLANHKKVQKNYVWSVIIVGAVLLAFSYNAFSYDIFNYIFDAKIITHYHANPYVHKALDYPGDPMLAFMHWTHREYPYGPVWLGLTVPLSFIGMQIFLITFFFFKMLMALSFLGTVYFIGKIFQKLFPQREIFGLIFFGLNPLVLIESLVSAHIDIVMMFLAVAAFSFLISQNYSKTYILLMLSIGIKFLTGILLPVFIVIHVMQHRKKAINWDSMFGLILILLMVGVVVESKQSGNFQPWYLLAPLSFSAFLVHKYYVLILTIVISVVSLFLYLPYLYLGNWDPPVPQLLSQIIIMSYTIAFCFTSMYFLYKQIIFAKAKKISKKK
ncbi:MAG: hypothetical protein ACREHC_04440 [Candidatus Levyibacteriota bacterium]